MKLNKTSKNENGKGGKEDAGRRRRTLEVEK